MCSVKDKVSYIYTYAAVSYKFIHLLIALLRFGEALPYFSASFSFGEVEASSAATGLSISGISLLCKVKTWN